MKTFADNAGRTWTVAINVDAIKRVRGMVGVDLLEVLDGSLIERFVRDPVLLCDVVYAVCKPEADSRGVSDEDFGRAMAGDAIEHATKALLEELVGFSPNPRDRENLRRVLGAVQQVMERTRDAIEQRIEAGELEKLVERALASVGGSSGSAPESSASIPDR